MNGMITFWYALSNTFAEVREFLKNCNYKFIMLRSIDIQLSLNRIIFRASLEKEEQTFGHSFFSLIFK